MRALCLLLLALPVQAGSLSLPELEARKGELERQHEEAVAKVYAILGALENIGYLIDMAKAKDKNDKNTEKKK